VAELQRNWQMLVQCKVNKPGWQNSRRKAALAGTVQGDIFNKESTLILPRWGRTPDVLADLVPCRVNKPGWQNCGDLV
jgi:hypothetical protein